MFSSSKVIFPFFLSFLVFNSSAQYNTIGSAVSQGQNCFELTNGQVQTGGIWYSSPLNLNEDFEIQFTMDIGIEVPNSADGIAFVLQDEGNMATLGAIGGSLGVASVNGNGMEPEIDPSVAVAFRTSNADQVEIWENGLKTDESDDGPYDMSGLSGVQNVTVYWNSMTQVLSIDIGNNGIDLNYNKDIVNDIFAGTSMVYWGITAATGGFSYNHFVCISPPQAIPTLGQWSLIILGIALSLFGLIFIRTYLLSASLTRK